ncbi:MAG: thioredoxin family protein [Alphaproteobacteria bacterium]|nr:thioredoxin family protein [Alphaproteobacteria bacterium]
MKSVKVLGAERCSTCTNLKNQIEKMIEETPLDATVEKITDVAKIISYGVLSTPALVVDEEIKCAGRVPSEKELKDWLS